MFIATAMGAPRKLIGEGCIEIENQKIYKKIVYCLQNAQKLPIRYLFYVIK